MRPDISSLALFIRVAELKSITKAAAASHIALAALSRRISQLEEQFGVQLLHRSARGVELTPAGTALLFHARQMMEKVDAMRAEISDYSKGAKGMVRVAANASALAQYLPRDLAEFGLRLRADQLGAADPHVAVHGAAGVHDQLPPPGLPGVDGAGEGRL